MNKEVKELFAKEHGITKEGYETTTGVYVIDLDNSNEFSKVYTLLDKADDVDLDIEDMVMNEEEVFMTYLADEFDIRLIANLKDKTYRVEIEEASD